MNCFVFLPQEHQTALHVSSRLGSIEAVQLLLQNNATRDATTKELYTPLHIAVKEGHEEVIQLLLDSGAKQKVKTKVCHWQGLLTDILYMRELYKCLDYTSPYISMYILLFCK